MTGNSQTLDNHTSTNHTSTNHTSTNRNHAFNHLTDDHALDDHPLGSASEVVADETIERVRQTVLDLLNAVPERLERLRVRAADVTVELEWPAATTSLSAPVGYSAPVPAADGPYRVEVPGQAGGLDATAGRPADETSNLTYVCAPMIGTFYHAPEPGAAPFVQAGAVVNVGQQVGIVEAMKLMLPVEADRTGRVVEILVGNGQPVEYGERLIALTPVDSA